MKIKKLPSGNFRIQPTINGKRKSVTFDHKPTQKEIMDKIIELHTKIEIRASELSFRQASELYVDSKRNVLSPSTIKSYKTYVDRFPEWFVNMKICDIRQSHVNRFVNEIAKDKTPKTVKNYHGFVHAVMSIYAPETHLTTKLPQNTKKDFYIPSDDDIKAIIKESIGTEYEIPIALACYGLRRSEIFAVSKESIKKNILIIDKSSVLNENNEMITKDTTKTAASTRAIPIPKKLADKIKKEDWHYTGYDGNLIRWLHRTQDKLGIERFSLHKMRHYFASKLSSMGVPEADILALGGWETDNIMKSVYRHSMMKDKQKSEISDKLSKELFS